MCVAAIAWRAHPRWPLVAIGNRDEYHDRPAAPLAPWDDGSGIVAGRDLRSGGTWLGIAPARGRFALVTNVRDPGGPDPGKTSRGALVSDALTQGDRDPASIDPAAYNPFNLIVATPDALTFVSNRPTPQRRALAPGIHGVSNGALDERWPKTLTLTAALADWLEAVSPDTGSLFAALSVERPPTAARQPAPRTAADAPWTSAPFIRDPIYGTRCATVLTVDDTGRCGMIERRFDAGGGATGETAVAFAWNSD